MNEERPAMTGPEWVAIATASQSPFIRTLSEWTKFGSSRRFQNTSLAKLTPDDLESFARQLRFVELKVDQTIVKCCCLTWYYGDLIEKHRFSIEQVSKVAELFGIGSDLFARSQDKFGDICDGDVCCRPRPGYSCPSGSDCSC